MSSVAEGNSKTANVEVQSCFQLIYRSRSLLAQGSDNDTEGLAEILKVARTNNGSRGVTGALVLYEYKNRFAQVLEGAKDDVESLFERIKSDPRHDNVEIQQAEMVANRVFSKWAMALVLEHREPDVPLIATTGGLSEAAPWRVTQEQEKVLVQLRDLTRGYGRAY